MTIRPIETVPVPLADLDPAGATDGDVVTRVAGAWASAPAAGGSTSLSTIGLRATLTTGVAVTTADVTGASTIYLTPDKSGEIATYDSGKWVMHLTGEVSYVLTGLVTDTNYDLFAYWTGSAIALVALAWTNDTTRVALARQDGVKVRASDHSRRFVMSFRTTSTSTTEDSKAKRFVSNEYNAVLRDLLITEATSNWSYGTNTWRAARGQATNCFEFLACSNRRLEADVMVPVQGGGVGYASGVGINSTTTNSAQRRGVAAGSGLYFPSLAEYSDYPGEGYTKATWLEIAYSSASVTAYGSPDAAQVSGMAGKILG